MNHITLIWILSLIGLPKVSKVWEWLTRKSSFLSFTNGISLLIDLIVLYSKHGLNQCVMGLVEDIQLSFHIR